MQKSMELVEEWGSVEDLLADAVLAADLVDVFR